MQYLQPTFAVYLGTDKYRANYDAINWRADGSDEPQLKPSPDQGKGRRAER